jgi:transposase InsO family protein
MLMQENKIINLRIAIKILCSFLRKECIGYMKYTKKDIHWLQEKINNYINYYYYERPHLSLGMKTPKEYLMSHLT